MPFVDDTAHAFVPYPDVPVAHAAGGPLAGLSFAVKDLFDVAGYPTGGGQPLVLAMSGTRPRHAAVVQRVLDAGARFVGKTVTDELAYSLNGQNAHFGNPVNGAAPARIAGGSSSGSASAVSNRLCDFALGTDTGGSVRAPASHCGLVGLRPTHGRVALDGAIELAPSFDTGGWFARDLPTFARVADVLLGPDPQPLPAAPRLLKPADAWALALPGVAEVFAAPLAALPHTTLEVALDGFDTMFTHFRHLQAFEAWQVHGPFLTRFAPPLGPGVAERFVMASKVTPEQADAARAFRARWRAHLLALLGRDGVLLLPTMPDIAPLAAQGEAGLDDYRNRALRLLCMAGLAGCPQLSLPVAHKDGAPIGLSLLGPPGSERSLLAFAEGLAL